MRQTAQGDVGKLRELVQIQGLYLHIAASFELTESPIDGTAFFGQGCKISQLGFVVAHQYFDGFGSGISACAYDCYTYHYIPFIKKAASNCYGAAVEVLSKNILPSLISQMEIQISFKKILMILISNWF